jgi:hypothetical protein
VRRRLPEATAVDPFDGHTADPDVGLRIVERLVVRVGGPQADLVTPPVDSLERQRRILSQAMDDFDERDLAVEGFRGSVG